MDETLTLRLTKILYDDISHFQMKHGIISDDFIIEALRNLNLYYAKNDLSHDEKRDLIGLGARYYKRS